MKLEGWEYPGEVSGALLATVAVRPMPVPAGGSARLWIVRAGLARISEKDKDGRRWYVRTRYTRRAAAQWALFGRVKVPRPVPEFPNQKGRRLR